jgi:hypothetical protein
LGHHSGRRFVVTDPTPWTATVSTTASGSGSSMVPIGTYYVTVTDGGDSYTDSVAMTAFTPRDRV